MRRLNVRIIRHAETIAAYGGMRGAVKEGERGGKTTRR
jgi:hypothetical protein